jgi:hypothetical protein
MDIPIYIMDHRGHSWRKDFPMRQKTRNIFILLLFTVSFLPLRSVSADTGPKPGMSFEFKQEFTGDQVTISSGVLLECEQSDCQDAKPLQQAGPQGFTCGESSCLAIAYGFSTYHQLEIQFSDGKTRRSNIFKTAHFNSFYTVTIRQDDLLVETKFSMDIFSITTVIFLCGGCLIGIIVIVVVILLVRRASKKK